VQRDILFWWARIASCPFFYSNMVSLGLLCKALRLQHLLLSVVPPPPARALCAFPLEFTQEPIPPSAMGSSLVPSYSA